MEKRDVCLRNECVDLLYQPIVDAYLTATVGTVLLFCLPSVPFPHVSLHSSAHTYHFHNFHRFLINSLSRESLSLLTFFRFMSELEPVRLIFISVHVGLSRIRFYLRYFPYNSLLPILHFCSSSSPSSSSSSSSPSALFTLFVSSSSFLSSSYSSSSY